MEFERQRDRDAEFMAKWSREKVMAAIDEIREKKDIS